MASADASRPRWLIAAGAVALAVVVVGGIVVLDDGDDEEPASSGADSTMPVTSSSTSTSTATSEPEGDRYEGVPFDELPESGIAVVDDERVLLLGFDGEELGEATTQAASEARGRSGRRVIAVGPAELEALDGSDAEAPPGCAGAAGGGGVRAALCGGEDLRQQIVLVEPTGGGVDLIGGAPGAARAPDGRIAGHWRWAAPSPDGRWVLAQWSGECEVPTAFLVATDGSEVKTVAGESGVVGAVTSTGVGWTPDGRVVVEFGEGLCSAGLEQPGIYLVDPGTTERTHVRSLPGVPASIHHWHRTVHGNEAERRLASALAELDVEGCCGEPSHGAPNASSGARWQGRDVPIGGWPATDPPFVPFNDLVIESRRIVVRGAPATAGEADLGAFVAFTCGGYVWTIGGVGAGDRTTADAVQSLAEALVPRLYCTVGDPPEAPGHGTP